MYDDDPYDIASDFEYSEVYIEVFGNHHPRYELALFDSCVAVLRQLEDRPFYTKKEEEFFGPPDPKRTWHGTQRFHEFMQRKKDQENLSIVMQGCKVIPAELEPVISKFL
jgi:hypothetical protein